jgi:hypothetical protein
MITPQAQSSFERIFQKAARSRLPQPSDDHCAIVPLARGDISAKPAANVIVLTISSIEFRLLLIFHFEEDQCMRDYFVKDAEQGSLREALLETGNLCCGAMNQELLHYFPDLGMSTPYVLSARCLPHLEALRPDYLSSYAITLGESIRLAATICVCANAPIDFVADISAVEESSGELELF